MEGRNVRKERRQEQAREDILDAAQRVLLDRGTSGLTLAAVGRELGLTKAALYYYFDSKEALVFELVFRGLERHAGIVGRAIAEAATGADAIESLIRTAASHYGERKDDLRLAYMVPQTSPKGTIRFDAAQLERVRPFNDQMYGAVAAKIVAEQQAGLVSPAIHGRRLAFLAHMAVIGMLTIEGLGETADDPLIHTRDGMVDELVCTFRARLESVEPK